MIDSPGSPLIRLFVVNTLLGYVAAAVFVALLFAFDIAHLWHLVITSDVPILATFLLWFFNGIVFSGAQVGIAVMNLAESDSKPPGGPGPNCPEPVRVRARMRPAGANRS